MGFWFGCAASNKRNKNQHGYGPHQAVGHVSEARSAINDWVAKHGKKLAGELGDLTYDASVPYKNDGTIQGEMGHYDALEGGVESSEDSDTEIEI